MSRGAHNRPRAPGNRKPNITGALFGTVISSSPAWPPHALDPKKMKTDTPRPILLKDYRPPNYLIDTVSLDVSLHPTRTRVWARLKVRRNPAWPGNPGPLRLDGETIELESVRLDGRQLDPREYQLSSKELVIDALPEDPFTIETVAYCNPRPTRR